MRILQEMDARGNCGRYQGDSTQHEVAMLKEMYANKQATQLPSPCPQRDREVEEIIADVDFERYALRLCSRGEFY